MGCPDKLRRFLQGLRLHRDLNPESSNSKLVLAGQAVYHPHAGSNLILHTLECPWYCTLEPAIERLDQVDHLRVDLDAEMPGVVGGGPIHKW